MAARGRGRGRGRGSSMSFDYTQLGFRGGEALPAPVLQPPPIFPPLEYKAVPLKSGPESKHLSALIIPNPLTQSLTSEHVPAEYMVALKRDFVEYLHSIRQKNDAASSIERFSDKYQIMNLDSKNFWDYQINWDFLPSELNFKDHKPLKRKLDADSVSEKVKKQMLAISKKLDELARLEVKDENEEVGEEAREAEEREGDEEAENRENIEEEDEDEEMDDGTDYVNNYFDNGEGYFDDEDDNLDDGPIY